MQEPALGSPKNIELEWAVPIDRAALMRELLPKLDSPRKVGAEIVSFCPAHPDGAKHHRRGGRSLEVNPDKCLIHCFAGCSLDAILAAFGVNPNGLLEPAAAPPPRTHATSGVAPATTPVAVYSYCDETGRLCGVKARFESPEGKSFKWRSPGIKDGWPGGIIVAEMPLWGAEAVAAADPQIEVVYVEGEKCVEALRAQGLLATTNGGGAGTRDFGDSLAVLRGRDVLLWPDNDPGGREYMRRVEVALRGIARSVRYAVPSVALPVGGDAADYFAAGGTWADIAAGLLREPVAEALADDMVRVRVPTPAGVVTLTFSQIEMGRRALDAELAMTFPAAPNELAYEERINLLSSSQRESTRRTLDQLYGKDWGWTRVIETAAPLVRKAVSEISHAVRVSDIEPMAETDAFALDPLLPYHEPTVLFAEGGAGKTVLAIRMAIALGLGEPFLRFPARQMRTMYVDYETYKGRFENRVSRVMRGLGLGGRAADFLFYYPGRGLALGEHVEALKREMTRWDIEFLVIDSAILACGGKPEDAEVANRYFSALARLSCTSLTISHITKAGETKYPFGSVVWWNSARAVWHLAKQQDERSPKMALALYARKGNDDQPQRPIGVNVTFDGRFGPVHFEPADVRDTPELQARRGIKDQLIDALRRGAMTLTALAEELDVARETARTTMRRAPNVFTTLPAPGCGENLWGLKAQS